MDKEEILVVKQEHQKLKIKVCESERNKYSQNRYEKIIKNKDYNNLAFLLYDLKLMGYDIDRAYFKFKTLLNDPSLFFLD